MTLNKTEREKIFNAKLDYSIKNSEKRMEQVNEIIENNDFIDDEFYNRFKTKGQNDQLQEDTVVGKKLSQLADYILHDYQYNNDYQKKKNEKEQSQDGEFENSKIFKFNQRKHLSNYRLPKKQTINKEELSYLKDKGANNIEDYYNFYQFCENYLKSNKNGKDYFKISRQKSLLKDDMILYKDSKLGVWGYNISPTNETTQKDGKKYDFTNDKVIMNFLKSQKPEKDFDEDLYLTWLDFHEMIKQIDFTEKEKIIIALLKEQYRDNEIENILGMKPMTLKHDKDRIIKKIKKLNNKYDF